MPHYSNQVSSSKMPQQATTASNSSCTQYLRSLHPNSVSGIISRIHLDALLLERKFTFRLFVGGGGVFSQDKPVCRCSRLVYPLNYVKMRDGG
ncbi:hypothetical protein CEXT_588351 [Caerostris extrusa]|uniref:Uncharacterized protein n=1 Tax=Caerostris extrusa TaxID=172846 RepID=A0AAV4PAK5_CAEEX|nr:hypothetical protein CEXT_588351 [Caerostris extrusa]